MTEHYFYKSYAVSALLLGEIAHDLAFVSAAKTFCDGLHVSMDPLDITKIMEAEEVHLIFGSLSAENEHLYLPVLQQLKDRYPLVRIVLFLQTDNLLMLDEILALKCDRYLSMKSEQWAMLEHFKLSIKKISRDVYLAEHHYFSTLIDNAIVSQTDVEGNITYVNGNFLKTTGYSLEELIGQNHRIIKHPQMAPEVFTDMWRTITQGEVWRAHVLNRNKDGSDFWAETMIIPFKDEISG